MSQGNPFQDLGGQLRGSADDPFGQYPFQQPNSRPQQQHHQQQLASPGAVPPQFFDTANASAPEQPSLPGRKAATPTSAPVDMFAQFTLKTGAGSGKPELPTRNHGGHQTSDNPFESMFGDVTGPPGGSPSGGGGERSGLGGGSTVTATGVGHVNTGAYHSMSGFTPSPAPAMNGLTGSPATAGFDGFSAQPQQQQGKFPPSQQQRSSFPPFAQQQSSFQQQKARVQPTGVVSEGALVPYQSYDAAKSSIGGGGIGDRAGESIGGDNGGGAGSAGALVLFGHNFEQHQQPAPSSSNEQHFQPNQGGAVTPFKNYHHQQHQRNVPQTSQQGWGGGQYGLAGSGNEGRSGGGLTNQQPQQASLNPFDDLFASVPSSSGQGEASPATQHRPQQQQQSWLAGAGGHHLNPPHQQHQQQQQQQYPSYQQVPQQHQQQLQQPFQANLTAPQVLPPVPPRGTPSGSGFDLFGDDPFGGSPSSLTTTEDGFIAVSGRPAATPPSVTSTTRNGDGGVGYAARGSRAPPLPARTPAPAPVANDSYDTFELFDQGGTYSSGSIRRSSGSSEYSGGRRSRGSSVPRNTQPPPPPSVVSSNVERWDAQGGRHRSSSVPRSGFGGRGRATPSQDVDPFGGNRGRHGPPVHGNNGVSGVMTAGGAGMGGAGGDDSDMSSLSHSRGASPTSSNRRRGIDRSSTMSDVSGGRGRGGWGRDGDRGRGMDRNAGRAEGGGVASRTSKSVSASKSVSVRAWRTRQDIEEEDGEEDGEGGGGDSDSENDDALSTMDAEAMRRDMGKRGRRETRGPAGGSAEGGGESKEEYEVEFERERRLGMLLERHDEWPDGRAQRSERAIVKMVVDSGPAQSRGVTVGSKVKEVNGEPVEGLTYQQTLDRIKNAARPLRVLFERGQLEAEDNVGVILFKKTVGVPRSYSTWQRRYYVLGGAVAKAHVLQMYVSKQSYDRMVLAVFGRQRINEHVKAYKLNNLFKCSSIKVKKYKGYPTPLNFFTVKLPTTRMKQLNFASHSLQDLQHLRTVMTRFTSSR